METLKTKLTPWIPNMLLLLFVVIAVFLSRADSNVRNERFVYHNRRKTPSLSSGDIRRKTTF